MKTLNLSTGSAESISTSGRVWLGSQIKEVHPHELFKMTETKLVLSLPMSMSASLPLPPIQVPKGLYQATDWRNWGPELLPNSDTPTSLHIQPSAVKRSKGDIRFCQLLYKSVFSTKLSDVIKVTAAQTRPSEPASSL